MYRWRRRINLRSKMVSIIRNLFLSILVATASVLAQTPSQPLSVTKLYNVTTYIDNRSTASRSNNLHTFQCVGTGVWTCQIQFADISPTGWTNFPDPGSSISNVSSVNRTAVFAYHDFIRFATTGSVVVNYSATRDLYTGTNTVNAISDASLINYSPPFTSSQPETVAKKLSESISVRDFGAVGDGTANDTAAFVAALAAVPTGGTVLVPEANYKITSTLTLLADQRLECASTATSLMFSGVTTNWINATGLRASIANCRLIPFASGDQHVGTALNITNHHGQYDNLFIYQPDICTTITTAYGNTFNGYHCFNGNSRGVNLLSGASSNVFHGFKEISGNSVAGSVGIYNDGQGSIFDGEELSLWDIGVKVATGFVNIPAAFIEANSSYAEYVSAGAELDECAVSGGINYTEPGGVRNACGSSAGYHLGSGMQKQALPSENGLSAYYTFTEGSGNVLIDYSGNGNHATINGSTTWAAGGPLGHYLTVPSSAGRLNYISVPPTAIVYNQPYTIAMLVNPNSQSVQAIDIVANIVDASSNSQIFFGGSQNGVSIMNYTANGNFEANRSSESVVTGRWGWIITSYNPSTHVWSILNPGNRGLTTFTDTSNPLTTATSSIALLQSVFASTSYQVASVAIWQRALGMDEAVMWLNQVGHFIPQSYLSKKKLGIGPCQMSYGYTAPETVIVGNPCDVYHNINGTRESTLWVKESGTGNTGWSAVVGIGIDQLAAMGKDTNIFSYSEPLLANLSSYGSGITQASFTELGLTNGVHFPADATFEFAYQRPNVAIVSGNTYTLTGYVVMDDHSVPNPGYGVNGTGYDFGPYLGTYYCAYPTVSYISNYTYRIACTFPGGTYTEPDVGWARNTNMTGKGFRVTGWQLELASSVSPYVAANGTPVALSSAVWAQQGQFGTAQVNLLQAKFPTSCTGLSSGMWYDNAGTLTKCP